MSDTREFYIVSLAERGHGDVLLFWKPDAAGYTTDVDRAGRYTAAEACRCECDGKAKAVPCREVETRAMRVVSAPDGPARWFAVRGGDAVR